MLFTAKEVHGGETELEGKAHWISLGTVRMGCVLWSGKSARGRVRRAPQRETQHSSIGRNGCHSKRWSHLEKSMCVREEDSQWHRKRNNIPKRNLSCGGIMYLPAPLPSPPWGIDSQDVESPKYSLSFSSQFIFTTKVEAALYYFLCHRGFHSVLKEKTTQRKKKGKKTKGERKNWQMRAGSWRESEEMISFIKTDWPHI